MDIKVISQEEFDSYEAPASKRGKYTEALNAVVTTGEPTKISGLTRGQVSALVRTVKDKKLISKAHYPTSEEDKNAGYVLIAKQPKN